MCQILSLLSFLINFPSFLPHSEFWLWPFHKIIVHFFIYHLVIGLYTDILLLNFNFFNKIKMLFNKKEQASGSTKLVFDHQDLALSGVGSEIIWVLFAFGAWFLVFVLPESR